MSALIDGKHPKIVIIDHYDDLIARLDVYAEETLEKLKGDEYINDYEKKEEYSYVEEFFNFDQIFERDQNSDKYTFDDPIQSQRYILLKDFVHSERMKAINEIKQIQKDRLEELKLAKTRPTTVEEALYGANKFGFLVNIEESKVGMSKKFKLQTILIDFYLDKEQIKLVE
jgi:hypothetical protein